VTKPRLSQALLWLLIAVTVVLFSFFVALVLGAIPIGNPRSPADSGVLRSESADDLIGNSKEHKLHSGRVSVVLGAA
jgi:hypothetical protein